MGATAVLGLRPHTYWTAAIVLGGEADAPRVVERRRIVFAEGAERMVYHRAGETMLADAPALIADVAAAVEARAAGEVGRLLADMRGAGFDVGVAVTAASVAKLPEALADILSVHSRMHAAEGDFYRDLLANACAGQGLTVCRPVERELAALTADRLGLDQADLATRLTALGAGLGPPWNEDYRLAALAAWLHLGEA
jgi:hypothetical protein